MRLRWVWKILFMAFVLYLLGGCDRRPKEQLLLEADQFAQAGNYRGAIVLINDILDKDPNYFEARYALANAYFQTSQYEKCQVECQKVLRQAPAFEKALLLQAEVYNRTGRPEKAVEEMGRHLNTHPGRPESLNILGRGYALQGDLGRAEDCFRQAMALDPEDAAARLNLARVFLSREEFAPAKELLLELSRRELPAPAVLYLLADMEISRGNRQEALSYFRRLQKQNPSDVNARYMIGLLLLDEGRLDEGEQAALELQKLFADHPAGFRLAGMAHFLRKDFSEAAVDLQTAIGKKEDLTAYYFLGLSYYALGRLELALNQFNRILDYRPSFDKARAMVALTLLKQGRLDDAVNEAETLLQASPDNGLAHNILGSVLLARNQFDRAMEEFDRAIALDPQLVDAHLRKGLFNLERGDSEAGESELVTVLQAAPEVLNVRLLLGAYYIRQQNFGDAIRTLKEGLTGQPEDALLYNRLAAAYFSQGKPDQAVAALEKAKSAKADYFAPYFNLAAYYSARADYQRALDQYHQALRIDPKNLQTLLNLAALQELRGAEQAARDTYEKAARTDAAAGLLAQAHFLYRQGRMSETLQVLDRTLADHPNETAALEMKGRVLTGSGRFDEADRVFYSLEKIEPGRGVSLVVAGYLSRGETSRALELSRAAIEKAPAAGYGYSLLARIYAGQKDYRRAEQTLKNGIGAARGVAQLQLQLGGVYERAGQLDRAMQVYQGLIRQSPGYLPGRFALGALYDRLGNKWEAVGLYQEVLARDRDFTPALNNLAYLLVDNYRQSQKGLELALQAYRNDPADPRIMDTLGFVLLQNGRIEEARKLLEKAQHLLPRNPTVCYHLALAYRDQGQVREAIAMLQKASSLGDFPEARQTRELLKKLNS